MSAFRVQPQSRRRDLLPTAPPRSDAYVGMLWLSLLALIGGAVLLCLYKIEVEGQPPPLPKSATVAVSHLTNR